MDCLWKKKLYEFSTILSKDLKTSMINQQPQFATNNNSKKIKNKIKLTKMQRHNEELQKLWCTLNDEKTRLNELNTNKEPWVGWLQYLFQKKAMI